MKDCGCDKKMKPKHTWLDRDQEIDGYVDNLFSPLKKNDILTTIAASRRNFINKSSLVNQELKENEERFTKITKEEFSLKLEALML